MQREIKFRFFAFGSMRTDFDGWSEHIGINEMFYYCKENDIKVMAYTGLKDKNGKEIYEGDIVHCLPSLFLKGVVVWSNELALFELSCKTENVEGTMTIYSHQENELNTKREVIGNIYETPDLLTKS